MYLLLALLASAQAGTMIVETTVAVEVSLDHQPLVKTFGAAQVELPDLPAGEQVFTVYRAGDAHPIQVDIPQDGVVRLLIGDDTLTADTPPAPTDPSDKAAPRVEFRGAGGGQFSLILDGERVAVFSATQPLVLDSLGVGEHSLEIRSPDLTVVWVRGTLALQRGDELIISASEGRMAEFFGRPDAFRPAHRSP